MSDLPAGWEETTLGGAGRWLGGGTPSKGDSRFWTGGTIPWVSPKDMKSPTIISAEDSITPAAIAESATNLIRPRSVLMVTRSGILRRTFPVAVTTTEVCINQDLKAIEPRDDVSPDYLAWFLRCYERDILETCSKDGTTVQSIETRLLQAFRVPLAPLPDQHRIVQAIEEQFSRLDVGVASLLRAKRNLTRMRESVVASLLGDKSWPTKPLGEIADVVGGVTKNGRREESNGLVEVPYLRVANVQRGHLDLSEIKTIRVEQGRAEALRLLPGDVLLNEGGDRDKLGRGWVWEGQIDHCIHQNHVYRARLCESMAPKFVSTYANVFGKQWFEARGSQTTNLASISRTALKQFPVPTPPLAEQEWIVAEMDRQFSILDAMEATVDSGLARGERLRQSILREAFAGRLVPQDLTDEPASVLLERINSERVKA